MKTFLLVKSLLLAGITFLVPGTVHAQSWRLVGITGQQGNEARDAGLAFVYPDHTLYEINLTTAAVTKLFQMEFVNDSQAIGYCPADGLLYHSAGSQSYSNNPGRLGHDQGGPDIPGVGYQDSQYMESVNLTTQVATAIYNADPCPNPDPALPCFGRPGPRPTWVLPLLRRDSTQTDDSFKVAGPNEYHAIRGMAWSAARSLFYVADEGGIFRLTAGGDCVFLARPAFPSDGSNDNSKGIAFVTVGGVTKLFIGHRNNGSLMEIDPDTGAVVAETALAYPPGGGDPPGSFGGLVGIEQHPVTGVLYGVRKTNDNFARELVTIDPVTGTTTLVGNLGLHVAGITFVPVNPPAPFRIRTVTRQGNDVTLTWTGGTPPYQVQFNAALTTGPWTNTGSSTSATTATVTLSEPRNFLRIKGQ